ncbi:uncharacterized protein LOC133175423 [Saccostrea echinata]|uniref:uncharacterized protein LOC133175423 n=1 Tax=Saccostrea echinata TaxID=191078 RepID=UPI002A83425B|nr:uncharacterized protein LOC133175423 [Saccostrea echinata]
MYTKVSLILFSVFVPEVVFGACRIFQQNLQAIPGKPVSLDCLYKNSIRVAYQETYRDHATCEDCYCTETGLECCGFGNNAGTFKIEGCIEQKDGCYSKFVDASDPTKPCPATMTTTQAPVKHVLDDQIYRNPFLNKDNSPFSSFGSPNSLPDPDSWTTDDLNTKSQRQRQYYLFLWSLINYFMNNN